MKGDTMKIMFVNHTTNTTSSVDIGGADVDGAFLVIRWYGEVHSGDTYAVVIDGYQKVKDTSGIVKHNHITSHW